MSEKLDYLIIGQGIAGTCLGLQLLKAGKKFKIINKTSKSSSSNIAAGIFNPITGRKMVKSWKADLLFPYLKSFYEDAEKLTNSKFYFEMDIYRPFSSFDEQNEWMGKSSRLGFRNFLDEITISPKFSKIVNDDFGGLCIKNGGFVDTSTFIDKCKDLYIDNNAYIEDVFYEEKVEILNKGIKYADLNANQMILCLGTDGINSKYFDSKAFNPVKGEILEIETDIQIKQIFNRGVFVLPIGGNTCWVGSNYAFKDNSYEITEKALLQIKVKADRLLRIPYRVKGQRAGIRPSSIDRRPVIGMHPQIAGIGIFNGLGSKGVSLAPYFSKQFFEFLENGKDLDSEVNLNRFF